MKKLFLLLLIVPFLINQSAVAQTKTTAQPQVKFLIHTDLGDMQGILYNETPLHRDNFVKLVKAGFYDGTLFHRVILGFMIQGGDPDSKTAAPGQQIGAGGPGYTIPAEFNPSLKHKRGALAAARNNNPQKASSGSQFYIVENERGTHQLDNEYTVFGEITSGFEVITKIASVQKGQGDRPVKDIKMTIKIVN